MFEVFLGNKPKKIFAELQPKTKNRLLELFKVLETNPWPAKDYDLRKLDGLDDCFRIRVGQYRICYEVNTSAKEVTVYRIELRSETTYK